MTPHLPSLIGHFLRRELRTLRLELEAYPDEQLIWVLPPRLPNSAGTLALHLAGNLRHYVGALLGGTGYIRNRDQEFAARDVPRVELLAQIAEAEAAIESTLPLLSEAQMSQPFPEPIRDHHLQTGELLVQLAVQRLRGGAADVATPVELRKAGPRGPSITAYVG